MPCVARTRARCFLALDVSTNQEQRPQCQEQQERVTAGHKGEGKLVEDGIAGGVARGNHASIHAVDHVTASHHPAQHEHVKHDVADAPQEDEQLGVAKPGVKGAVAVSPGQDLAEQEESLDNATESSHHEKYGQGGLQRAVIHVHNS